MQNFNKILPLMRKVHDAEGDHTMYLSIDWNRIRACLTRSLGELPRQDF